MVVCHSEHLRNLAGSILGMMMSLSKVVTYWLNSLADLVVTLNVSSEAEMTESDIIYYERNISIFKVII